MEFNELMKQFTEKCEVRDVTVEDDVVALEIDGVVFAFIHDPGSAVLTVVADLGQQSIDADGPFGAMMLQANFLFEATRGATLFQNPENKSFGLQQQYRLVYLDADMLAAEVEKLAKEGGSVKATARPRDAETPGQVHRPEAQARQQHRELR